MNTQEMVLRARVWDEPFAIKKLAYSGYQIIQGTDYEDWQHIDIKVVKNGRQFNVDVKRNDATNRDSLNFCFTYINNKGQYFPFKDDAYFFFIDELNYKCYLVIQTKFQDLLDRTGRELSNPRTGKARLVRIKDIVKIASVTLDCDKYDIQYLKNT